MLCKQQNIEADAYTLDDITYKKALKDKLEEEAQEVMQASDQELLEELADVQEVVDAILKAYGFTKQQLHQAQDEKRNTKGSFDKKIYIKSFTIADDSPWKEHFLKQPHKYQLKK